MNGMWVDHKSLKVLIEIQNLHEMPKRAVRRGLYEYGSLLRKNIRDKMKDKRRSGIERTIYRRGRRYRHVASGPEETPAKISGNLRRSVDFKVEGSYKMRFGYDNSVEYGEFLEKGTSKMKARPGLKNTITKTQKEGINLIRNEINKRL